jgi:holin-like protein
VRHSALLIGFWAGCEAIKHATGAPVPGSVLALAILLFLLCAGWLPLRAVQHGTRWLIGEMLLFFVPPMLSLLNYPQFFGLLGLKLIFAIVVSTLLVMVVTALTIEVAHGFLHPRRVDGNA